MIKPNWDIFKVKSNDNPQNNFEWFCYLLFCKEFNKPTGIFRYKNQSAIETDPIMYEDESIGWQAKFYDKTLSNHKPEIINFIEKTKRDYPDITKLFFYSNQEWAKSRNKKPKGQLEVEEKSKILGIEIVWRGPSFFESQFVSIDNELIAKHFFSFDKSIFNIISDQHEHSENILYEIQSTITYKGKNIKINRSDYVEKIKISEHQVMILSGSGGVGKTALIKDYYEEMKDNIPFYIFKATEFDKLRNINEFFTGYNFNDFFVCHKEESNKIIVIDSAEKLLDIGNSDPFKEFLSTSLKENWKIIFTTRESYVENLNYLFFEIYRIAPKNINIQNLSLEELKSLSQQYNFVLPDDQKLISLLKILFHFKEYLQFYSEGENLSYAEFKNKSWNQVVKNKPAREQCFLKIAFQRANEGQFFVRQTCESNILDNELRKDGILGYESPHGYFITHDIYEEWALEKVIEIEFANNIDYETFLKNIGNSLPIRSAFRKWVSEKLLVNDTTIKSLIEDIIKSGKVELFWQDEILVSVLLSDYSDTFFEIYKNQLLTDNYELLRKLTFLLRIACKEVDDGYFKRLGENNIDLFSLKYILTKPKGQGWNSLIKFIFENIEMIGIQNINFVLPIIHDWNKKFSKGKTTRYSGLIALQYYEWTIKEDIYHYNDNSIDNIIETILYSSSEIIIELDNILKSIINNKWKKHHDPYYELSKTILTKFEGISICEIFPKDILKIADLFWTRTPKNESRYGYSRDGVEKDFGLEEEHLEYFPASSYQTPIYWLLRYSLKETIDFILDFTTRSAKSYANSRLADSEVNIIDVFVSKDKKIKQYISNRLWCTYRGTQVSPYALESMHMALEKFFLEQGENVKSKVLESWLFYLLENSESASISAIVASIVTAFPEKTFNVAAILFQTKEFFFYDTRRIVLEHGHKSGLQMIKSGFGIHRSHDLHEDERIKACDDKHRKWSLENVFLQYQLFRSEKTSEKESEYRQNVLWKILDNYYEELDNAVEKNEHDNTWRLYLARMDKRKMEIETKKTDEGILINFKPELNPELKEYSDKSLKQSSDAMKYTALKLWANLRNERDEKYGQYKQYEENPSRALKEVKAVIKQLLSNNNSTTEIDFLSLENNFHFMWNSIPGDVCSVLIRDFFDRLTYEEKEFCIEVILEVASVSTNPGYNYQISDGVQSVISVLPIIFDNYHNKREKIKEILLFLLFHDHFINAAGTSFNIFPITAIHRIWKNHELDVNSILIGYLVLKPIYHDFREKVCKENYKKQIFQIDENKFWQQYLINNQANIKKILNNKIISEDVGDINQIDLFTLRTAFQIIPLGSRDIKHKELALNIISVFIKKLTSKDRDERIDYSVRHDFLNKLANIILNSTKIDLQDYLKPLLDNFGRDEIFSDMFKEFISAEDYSNSYENFWEIWNTFKPKIIEMCNIENWYSEKLVKGYLFAMNNWKESATDWHTFKDENKKFFEEISEKIGQYPFTLYSISKLLYGIGSNYLNEGICWLAGIFKRNNNLLEVELETNTIYYLENVVKKYITINREKIKKNKGLKNNVLVILNFLIQKGSVIGYILRENIL